MKKNLEALKENNKDITYAVILDVNDLDKDGNKIKKDSLSRLKYVVESILEYGLPNIKLSKKLAKEINDLKENPSFDFDGYVGGLISDLSGCIFESLLINKKETVRYDWESTTHGIKTHGGINNDKTYPWNSVENDMNSDIEDVKIVPIELTKEEIEKALTGTPLEEILSESIKEKDSNILTYLNEDGTKFAQDESEVSTDTQDTDEMHPFLKKSNNQDKDNFNKVKELIALLKLKLDMTELTKVKDGVFYFDSKEYGKCSINTTNH